MNWNVSFEPVLPWALIAVMGVAGIALLVMLALGRSRGTPLRAVAFALLLAALANPVIRSEARQPLPDIAVAVIDHSLSQQSGERMQRTDAAVAALKDAVARLPNTELRTVEVKSGASSEDDGTRAFEVLNRALGDIPPERFAGAIMITDGEVHDAPADPAKSGIGGPLHALITGSKSEKDRQVVIEKAPRFGMVGQQQTIAFRLDEANGPGQSVPVTVSVGGAAPSTIDVTPGQTVEVPITVDHAGQNIVEITAPPLDGEISLQNNRAVAVIDGVRDRLRVLLVSGEPHPGERTWRNLLKADPAVDLVHFTILRPPDKDDATPVRELSLISFPVRELFEEKLSRFDLVIFDRFRRRGVLSTAYYQALADYVENGGALLASVGPEFAEPGGLYDTPLARVLPGEPEGRVLAQPFRPALAEPGRRHPVTAGLTGADRWGRWLRQIPVRQKSGTALLAGIDGRPLVILDKVGQGRVAEVLSDTIWLWARGWEGGGPHDELLRRLAHWLMREPDLEEESLAAEIRGDRLEVTRRSLAPAATEVEVTRPDGATLRLPLVDQGDGRATARLAIDQPGLWRVADGGLSAVAAAGNPSPLEMAELAATPERLRPVAEATGGAVRWLAEGGVPELRRVGSGRVAEGRGWIGLAARGEHLVSGLKEFPLLPAWLLLLIGGGALLAAWLREGD